MTSPKPHDVRQVPLPEEITAQFNSILDQETSTLAEQTQQLQAAHEVLRRALN
ncbi:hypothetical protein P4N68_01405 [Corynebacterium felinum]|uniref:Uncharacterized protein n=1 Tax=Corynebacterium felinum TaxID=131318 RepID=A0ABU2BC32_9CORY|nr:MULTISPECIES: hypothetical protein [Corynebacterium]MDF5819737.1 hypothetical protein [Corynebacterium felinum]MDO4761878.1 hypothetical protein [Corynebacterium sp.]MDR7355544.1 hypothetical protein [Corynebacterium felinum]WJY94894.1 hypothetical protein CFELI_06385 [Corynebacterium felinum]